MSTNQKEITLPSGARLKIQLAPFADAKELYKTVLREIKTLKIDMRDESERQISSYILEAFCGAISSDEVERAVHRCMERCLYNGARIAMVDQTFEPEEARVDYMKAMIEVGKENIAPFLKALFAEFRDAVAMVETTPRPI